MKEIAVWQMIVLVIIGSVAVQTSIRESKTPCPRNAGRAVKGVAGKDTRAGSKTQADVRSLRIADAARQILTAAAALNAMRLELCFAEIVFFDIMLATRARDEQEHGEG
jgi:hypothetical protein